MALIGFVGGVELAVLFIFFMIGYVIYAIGRENERKKTAADSENEAETR
jgi:hypothetical protein